MGPHDLQILSIDFDFETHRYRSAMKFGGMVVEQVTILNVHCTIRQGKSHTASGFGSMPLGNVWSFPSKTLGYDQTLGAMRTLASRIAAVWRTADELPHPVQVAFAIEPRILSCAQEVDKRSKLGEPIPDLCALVVSSAFDAALHDAYGKLHGSNVYSLYGKDRLCSDLATFLGPAFAGLYLDQFVNPTPKPTMPLYHLVGALDPIDPPAERIGDGLPEHLAEWIAADGLSHLKIKLDGRDLIWDIQRVADVHRVAQSADAGRAWKYSLDFNERCESPAYVKEFIEQLREYAPHAFELVQYIEQPTSRNLEAHKDERYHEIAKQVPVVIDEALIGLESLLLARELGYSGCALKACKGQTQSLLMGAAAQKLGMFLCVQDLTCPGASLIQSVGLAAHLPGVAAIEANARQYVPVANAEWIDRFPGIFRPKNGMLETGVLTGLGLGAVP
jgi:L-alanine-DL-glutamate epimerase-like enolase superfamily enzyme